LVSRAVAEEDYCGIINKTALPSRAAIAV